MKLCQIHKTKKSYKIITMYKLDSESYILSNPIHIISIDVPNEVLCEKIFNCLEHSRVISESEEDRFWLGNKLLKELKERSYNFLYINSDSCMFSIVNNKFIIEPQRYVGNDEGLEVDRDRVVEIDNKIDRLKLMDKIIKALE